MPENPRGWRRLWPSALWLQTVEVPAAGSGVWQWKIWSEGKDRLIACGAETYTRQATAARGGVRFGESMQQELGKAGGAEISQT